MVPPNGLAEMRGLFFFFFYDVNYLLRGLGYDVFIGSKRSDGNE